jgi:hypothetical protein
MQSEAGFSHALVLELKKSHAFVQRIESGITGVGIPDIYVRWKEWEAWIELKQMNYYSIYDNDIWTIPWRKGQRAWATAYYKISGMYTYTAVILKDGYIVIPMNKRYKDNIVNLNDVLLMTDLKDVVDVIKRRLI